MQVFAGPRARARLLEAGLRADDVRAVPAAAGGPKGLVLIPLDRLLFGHWLHRAGGIVHLLGASIGAWRMASACLGDADVALARLAEDYIFFNSQEAAFLSFGDAVSTGSSLMPQKRNPDAMELVRGKAAKVQGLMQSLMVLLKGLPLGYDRDLQIDKELLFQIVGDTGDSIAVAALAVEHARFDVARCAAEAERGFLNATDLADLLVQAGVPFREAHGTAGAAVNRAVELGCELQDLPHDEQRRLLPQLDVDLREELTAARVLARRDVVGGTAPHRVQKEAERWQIVLQEWGEGYGELEELDPDGEDPLAVADDD